MQTNDRQTDEHPRCLEAAMRMLAAREHGARELQQKLRTKGYDPDLAAEVLTQLQQDGLQSDARFAESFVRSRVNKGHGPERIRMELQQKGVASGLIQQAMEEQQVDWFAQAAKVRARKFGPALPDVWKEKARQGRFLQYRGYTAEQIRHALAVQD